MVAAWLITLPAAAVVGAVMWYLGDFVGGLAGASVIFALLLVLAAVMWLRSRVKPVDQSNVNDEWDTAPAVEDERVPAGTAAS